MARTRLPAWGQTTDPSALDETSFQQWLRNQAKHQQQVEATTGCVDLTQYVREIEALHKLMAGCERTRSFKRGEQEAAVHEGNLKLVHRLCELARQADKRKDDILSPPADEQRVAKAELTSRLRQQKQTNIEAENKALVKRLASMKPVIPTSTQAATAYRRHTALISRLTRVRHTPGSVARRLAEPPKPLRQPKKPRPPLWEPRSVNQGNNTPVALDGASSKATTQERSKSGGSERARSAQPRRPLGQRPHTAGPLSTRTVSEARSKKKDGQGDESTASAAAATAIPKDAAAGEGSRPAPEEPSQNAEPKNDGYDEEYGESDFEEDFEEESSEDSSDTIEE
mmetsp:Transcript_46312/g.110223  ORF Transcript_46312/g.110223 Transcript_46312/m.110223 type:complete len:341 (-) Transcript_46312:102-1124(-)